MKNYLRPPLALLLSLCLLLAAACAPPPAVAPAPEETPAAEEVTVVEETVSAEETEPSPVPAATSTGEAAPIEEPSPVPAAEPSPVPAAEPSPVPAAEPSPVPAAEPSPVPEAEPSPAPAVGTDAEALTAALNQTAAYVYAAVPNPQVGSVGGEWAVIGLARAGWPVPESYYETYYQTVAAYARERDGVLHSKKYTEYSRVVLALTAAGYDARDAGGYDLTLPLADFSQTIWQGLNGPIWALIALDSAAYPLSAHPTATVPASRDLYLAEILRRQLADGGFNLTAGAGGGAIAAEARAEVDITGMALQALAPYRERPEVQAATDKALACLSALQGEDGGFGYRGEGNLESAAQVLTALTALGLSLDDPRFVKNGRTILSNILSFSHGDGSFRHSASGGNSQMSTEQALYALAAAQRSLRGQNSLYQMSDAARRGG